jgi:restriction endonuclease Mrr
LEVRIREANERVSDDIRKWLEQIDWRTFEITFLIKVLEALGFKDVQPTQATRDGGVDARVTYKRGIIEARAIVSAKRWKAATVPVDEVRNLRGLQGNEDIAIVVTTGIFSSDAKEAAQPSQNRRAVYLIDGEMLIDVCKRHQIGVKEDTATGAVGARYRS